MRLKQAVLILTISLWPIGLYLANTPANFFRFITPALLLTLALKYYRCNSKYYFLPILIIPLIEPKLALFPLLFTLVDLIPQKISKLSVFYLALSFALLVFSFNNFSGQTIFKPDYEAQQKVIRDQQLYPNPTTARIFHNKARVVIDKANENFFETTDPSNYLFGFAPRQVIERNQNLNKYPFLALPFLLLGLYCIAKNKDKNFVITSSIAAILALIPLTLYDRNDFLLYVPITLIIIHGLSVFDIKMKSKAKYYYILFILAASIELTRSIIQLS